MMRKIIFDLALTFVLRQLIKYGESVEWQLVREDIRERIRKVIPGDAFDDAVVDLLDRVIDGMEFLVENLEIAGVLQAIKEKELNLAFEILKDLMRRYLGI